jgi:hypothetical protein
LEQSLLYGGLLIRLSIFHFIFLRGFFTIQLEDIILAGIAISWENHVRHGTRESSQENYSSEPTRKLSWKFQGGK